ncbi:general transcription factor IIE subunit 1-like [Artemia franciscana]|uniref:general transcription factor IIE subunit 1-like n=1 Tax=Artemia franciscana TaxID=6661 RepID=UPI0032D9FB9E
MEDQFVTEIPNDLKQLVRLVSRGFYQTEDRLILDMLIRNPCMKETDLAALLRFDIKMLKSRINTLKKDKIVQIRMISETGPDEKVVTYNYCFINYKSFVNVVKYKLDHMRRKMEAAQMDATRCSRYKCTDTNINVSCGKTFDVLEIDRLKNPDQSDRERFLICNNCQSTVEEDESAINRQDGRMVLKRYNEQIEPIWHLLQQVENIKLDPKILEPEPSDIIAINRVLDKTKGIKREGPVAAWTEVGAKRGTIEESRLQIRIGDDAEAKTREKKKKEQPTWLVGSTIRTEESIAVESLVASTPKMISADTSIRSSDIMSVLLQHEKIVEGGNNLGASLSSDSAKALKEMSDEEYSFGAVDENSRLSFGFSAKVPTSILLGEAVDSNNVADVIEAVETNDEDEEAPTVFSNGKAYTIREIDEGKIALMSASEKEAYVQAYQDYYFVEDE